MESGAAPKVVECPHCSNPLAADHAVTWCTNCGKPLPEQTIAAIQSAPKQRTATSKRTTGITLAVIVLSVFGYYFWKQLQPRPIHDAMFNQIPCGSAVHFRGGMSPSGFDPYAYSLKDDSGSILVHVAQKDSGRIELPTPGRTYDVFGVISCERFGEELFQTKAIPRD